MAGITLQQAQQKLQNAMDAYDKALQAQDYQISTSTGGRRVQRASLKDLQGGVDYWQQQVNRLSRGGQLAVGRVVPL